MADVATLAFLPSPRLSLNLLTAPPDPDWLDSLHPGGGDFVREWQALHTTVVSAIDTLEAGRPGGTDWGDAMGADAADVVAGRSPKVWATAQLLGGDFQRWAYASAQARTVSTRVTALRTSAPAAALIDAAQARWEALREPLFMESEKAYRAAVSGDSHRGEAWTHFDSAVAMAADGARHAGLVAWLDGRDQVYDPQGWPAPWTPEGRGFMLSTSYILQPEKRPLTVPQGVQWPDGVNLPNVPVGERGQSLRDGGFATPDMDDKPINPARDRDKLKESLGLKPKAPQLY